VIAALREKPSLFIDGEWVESIGGGVEDVINPATEQAIAVAPVGTLADAEAAIAAARRAFDDGPWGTMSGKERGGLLARLHEILVGRQDEIADLLVEEIGAVPAAALNHHVRIPLTRLEYYAELARRDWTKTMPMAVAPTASGSSWLGGSVVAREPAGVAALITPFNFPFYLNIGKLAPCLAAGCTAVLKPSPYTPLTAMVVAEAVAEAGLPPGVVNVVTGGLEVGALLTTDRRVDLVSFTGSDTVGAAVMAQAAPSLKRVILELGGKSALIVRADADLAAASAMGVGHMITQAGQGCALCTRHVVHASVRGEYLARLKAGAEAVKVGVPTEAGVGMGPLIREQQRARVEHFVQAGLDEGATLVTGGKRPADLDRGYFYEPTVLADVDNSSAVCQNEIFGPVAAVLSFEEDDEAVAIANDSEFGLSGAIFSADVGAAYQMARRIRTGRVDLNGGSGTGAPWDPFGGIKRSGMGREDGEEGMLEYMLLKTIRFHAG
jgi:aldehyde dehydrogenase (NAD+)